MHSHDPTPHGVLRADDASPEIRDRLRTWLAVQYAFGLAPQKAREALDRDPDPRRLLAGAARVPAPRDLDAAVGALAGAGALAIPYGSPSYPERVARLVDAPPLLVVRGDAALLGRTAVAIVGARAASVYGVDCARRFAAGLASAGAVVVSGLAVGIDAAAHRAALDAGGATVAVQACGPDRVYPVRHRRLAAEIAGSGGVLTEHFPGTAPLPAFFPLRNRLISALADAVLVVEARERSGSLLTAGHAANQGVDVFAVPGPISAPTSRGTNRLIRDGAGVALEPDDLLAELGIAAAPSPPAREGAPSGPDPARVLATLERGPCSRDELVRRLGWPQDRLARALVELELGGRIAADRDGRLRIVSPAGAPGL